MTGRHATNLGVVGGNGRKRVHTKTRTRIPGVPAVGTCRRAAERSELDCCATMDAYKVVRIVGKGAFGAAVLVHAKNNPREQYVVKQVDVSKMKQKEKDEAKKVEPKK